MQTSPQYPFNNLSQCPCFQQKYKNHQNLWCYLDKTLRWNVIVYVNWTAHQKHNWNMNKTKLMQLECTYGSLISQLNCFTLSDNLRNCDSWYILNPSSKVPMPQHKYIFWPLSEVELYQPHITTRIIIPGDQYLLVVDGSLKLTHTKI